MKALATKPNSEIWRFILVGIGTYVIDFLTYWLLVWLGVHYLLADLLNLPLELAFNYLGHKFFTFYTKSENQPKLASKHTATEITRYLMNVVIQGAIALVLLYLMVDILSLEPVIAKATQLVILPAINFLFLKRFVFKNTQKPGL